MIAGAEDFRYERKFIIADQPSAAATAAMLLRVHPALFREIYTERWVNSVYYDSIERDYFAASENGQSEREKIRIRWYGAAERSVLGAALEQKRKRNAVGTKLRWKLPDTDLSDLLDRRATRRLLASADVPEGTLALFATLQPDLFTRYRRRYYLSACGRFRATLDTNLEHREVGLDRLLEAHAQKNVAIVELKYAVEHDGAARSICDSFGVRSDKSSKYVTGMLQSRI
jgi:hypothetical protein